MNMNDLCNGNRVKASDSVNWLLSNGISSITTEEYAAILGIPTTQLPQRMAALKHRKEIVSPAQGLWIPIPPEYMSWGAPPAMEYIDALMCYLHAAYYVGWLSAAAWYGAAYHAPQVFQVATSRAIRGREVGRTRFQFYSRNHIQQLTLQKVETKSGSAYVSNRETTLMDIANDIGIVGGIDNAVNLIIELSEDANLNMEALTRLSAMYPVTASRRLGYLLECYTDVDAEELHTDCRKREAATSLLDPQGGRITAINKRWKLGINREVSPDL